MVYCPACDREHPTLTDVERCDVCGIWTRDPHNPHDRGCPQTVDCDCDNTVCSGCCWDCRAAS